MDPNRQHRHKLNDNIFVSGAGRHELTGASKPPNELTPTPQASAWQIQGSHGCRFGAMGLLQCS
jgi:hypothetical protein